MNKCEICRKNRMKLLNGKYYCKNHFKKMKKYGRIWSRKQKNKINIKDDYAEIEIYNNKGDIIALTKIDIEDVEKAKKFKWGLTNNYIYSRTNELYLHRFILGNNCQNRKIVTDHINRNKLDNRKRNLRIVSQRINTYNNNCFGIYYRNKLKKWESHLGKKYLGIFANKDDALAKRKTELNKLLKEVLSNG